jgi:hypothetical protein
MQKLKGISSGQNNKSCRIIHNGSKKFVLHFSDFSVIFYAIYKKQGNDNTIGVILLQEGPWKELLLCNVALGAAGRRGWANSGELAGARGRGRAGEGSRVP